MFSVSLQNEHRCTEILFLTSLFHLTEIGMSERALTISASSSTQLRELVKEVKDEIGWLWVVGSGRESFPPVVCYATALLQVTARVLMD